MKITKYKSFWGHVKIQGSFCKTNSTKMKLSHHIFSKYKRWRTRVGFGSRAGCDLHVTDDLRAAGGVKAWTRGGNSFPVNFRKWGVKIVKNRDFFEGNEDSPYPCHLFFLSLSLNLLRHANLRTYYNYHYTSQINLLLLLLAHLLILRCNQIK